MTCRTQATVYFNGQKVTYHEGSYSIFRADVTNLCVPEGENLLVINCSNEYEDSVYPQSAGLTFYGGLYRGINIISVFNKDPEAHQNCIQQLTEFIVQNTTTTSSGAPRAMRAAWRVMCATPPLWRRWSVSPTSTPSRRLTESCPRP